MDLTKFTTLQMTIADQPAQVVATVNATFSNPKAATEEEWATIKAELAGHPSLKGLPLAPNGEASSGTFAPTRTLVGKLVFSKPPRAVTVTQPGSPAAASQPMGPITLAPQPAPAPQAPTG
jgi:hypothetical protein